MNPMLTSEFYRRFYSGKYWDLTGRGLEPRFRTQVGRAITISKALNRANIDISGLQLLDVGAGIGGVSFALRKIWGVHPTTIDPDKRASAVSTQLGNSDLRKSASRSFDVLILIHVLEHQREPAKFLHQELRRLRIGGLVCIEVPNGLEVPDGGIDHPLVFTPDSLGQTLATLGYQTTMFVHRGHGRLIGPKKYLLCIARKAEATSNVVNRIQLVRGFRYKKNKQSWIPAQFEVILARIFLRKSISLKRQLTNEALSVVDNWVMG